MKKLLMMLMVAMLSIGFGMTSTIAEEVVVQDTLDYKVGDPMPDYTVDTKPIGHESLTSKGENSVHIFYGLCRNLSTSVSYAVFYVLENGGDGLFFSDPCLPFLIVVGEGAEKTGILLVDNTSKGGKKMPDGFIDEVVKVTLPLKNNEILKYYPR